MDLRVFEIQGAATKKSAFRRISKNDVPNWIETCALEAKNPESAPAIKLLVIETPGGTTYEKGVEIRGFRDEIEDIATPLLGTLHLTNKVLMSHGTIVVQKRPLGLRKARLADAGDAGVFTYHIAFALFSLSFRHFPESRTSIGIVLNQSTSISRRIFEELAAYGDVVGQPELLPFLAQQNVAKEAISYLRTEAQGIVESQVQIGYFHSLSLQKSSKPIDYSRLSAKTSGIAFNIVTYCNFLKVLLAHTDSILHGLEKTMALQHAKSMDNTAADYLRRQLICTTHMIRDSVLSAEAWQAKAAIMTQGIFNLIAQQDQNASLAIARQSQRVAEESKKDSTSLKAISVVTMTFLPGTFAATIFSMAMFDWDATKGADVVNHRFWVYWATTIPLTILTFLAWILWLRYQREDEAKERNGIPTSTQPLGLKIP